MSKIRVVLVDDHPVFLEGLYTILRLRDPEIEVVGTATNGEEALKSCEQLQPNVVLLDIKMPVMDGVEAARALKERFPATAIIMLTTFDDRPLIRDALGAGATGYLLKDAEVGQIVAAIKQVSEKNIVISGDLALKLAVEPESAEERSDHGAPDRRRIDPTGSAPNWPLRVEDPSSDEAQESALIDELSERQQEVLRLLARGKTNAEISAELFLSEKTVRNYISQIYEVINVHTRTKAATWAMHHLPDGIGGSPPQP
jgi:DNA-binding NarL/FixJ family response regulator